MFHGTNSESTHHAFTYAMLRLHACGCLLALCIVCTGELHPQLSRADLIYTSSNSPLAYRMAFFPLPAAAAAEGGGVPKGYFAVYAGEESRRFVVPTEYLREPAFRDLMERAADAPRRTWRTSCAASSARTPPATRGRRPSGRRVEKALSRFLFVQFALTCRDEIS